MKKFTSALKAVLLIGSLTMLTSCGSTGPEGGGGQPHGGPGIAPPVLNLDAIPSDECVFYKAEDVAKYIKMAQSECLKKALESGVDPNSTHVDGFFGTKTVLLEAAFNDDSLFFTRNNRFGQASIIALLLKFGGDPNKKFEDGRTVLERALRTTAQNEEVTLYVMHFPQVDVNLTSAGGNPLEIAIDVKRENLIQVLLNRKAKVNETTKDSSPAHQAMEKDLFASVLRIFDAGADLEATNAQDATLLQRSIAKERREIFDRLMAKSVKFNTQSDDRVTPLVTALRANDEYFFTKLLGKGADLEIANANGETALYLAVAEGRNARAKTLIQRNANVNVKSAAENNSLLHVVTDLSLAKTLKERNVAFDTLNNRGETPLSLNVLNNRAPLVRYLLDCDSSERWTSSDGASLLHRSVLGDSIEITKILLARGLKLTLEDDGGREPIFFVGSQDMLGLLTGAGAVMDVTDKSDFHPFTQILTRHQANYELIASAIEKGGKPDSDVARNFFPLQYVVEQGNLTSTAAGAKLLNILLKGGANSSQRDLFGKTVIHIVRDMDNLKVLSANGANLSVLDNNGRTLRSSLEAELKAAEKRLQDAMDTGDETSITAAEKAEKPKIALRKELLSFLTDKGA